MLVQIFSHGAVDRLYQALPILFVWEIVLLPVTKIAMHHRCIAAARAEQEEEQRVLALLDGKGEEMVLARASSVGSGSTHVLHRMESSASRKKQIHGAGDEYWPAVPVPFGGSMVKTDNDKDKDKDTDNDNNDKDKIENGSGA